MFNIFKPFKCNLGNYFISELLFIKILYFNQRNDNKYSNKKLTLGILNVLNKSAIIGNTLLLSFG